MYATIAAATRDLELLLEKPMPEGRNLENCFASTLCWSVASCLAPIAPTDHTCCLSAATVDHMHCCNVSTTPLLCSLNAAEQLWPVFCLSLSNPHLALQMLCNQGASAPA